MTKEELVGIIDLGMRQYGADLFGSVADRILAALEKEREGEVVVAEGKFNHDPSVVELVVSKNPWEIYNCGFDEIHGKKGQLIFRPIPSEKEGA